MSPGKSLNTSWLYLVYILLLLFPCFELAVRYKGGKAFQYQNYSLQSIPSNNLIPDSTFGINLNPGQFDVTINDKLQFHCAHNDAHYRETNFAPDSTKATIALYGCSFTYGTGVDDSLTFCSQLQKEFKTTRIINYAVPGHGTVQNYLLLKKQLSSSEIPDMVVINFSELHIDRNCLAPNFRRDLKNGYQMSMKSQSTGIEKSMFPFVSSSQPFTIDYCNWEGIYRNWPGRTYSAGINVLQNFFDGIASRRIPKIEYSLAVFHQIRALCDDYNCKLLITNLTESLSGKLFCDYLSASGYDVLNISIDRSQPENTNFPHDSHFNAKTHKYIASLLLSKLVANGFK